MTAHTTPARARKTIPAGEVRAPPKPRTPVAVAKRTRVRDLALRRPYPGHGGTRRTHRRAQAVAAQAGAGDARRARARARPRDRRPLRAPRAAGRAPGGRPVAEPAGRQRPRAVPPREVDAARRRRAAERPPAAAHPAERGLAVSH